MRAPAARGCAGVQFHPESVLTLRGADVVSTLLRTLAVAPAEPA
ncbi:hypothetical protein [Streptomyces sp. WAC07061]|nr:hypothetical protein [Streptomyces sp. WAC07061]